MLQYFFILGLEQHYNFCQVLQCTFRMRAGCSILVAAWESCIAECMCTQMQENRLEDPVDFLI